MGRVSLIGSLALLVLGALAGPRAARAETCKEGGVTAAAEAGVAAGAQTTTSDITTEQMAQMSIGDLLDVQTTVASTKEATVFTSPSTVVVIDRETIERYNFQTVGEAVNTLAGFANWKTSSFPDVPTSRWILQFHYPNKILLMINGVPAWTPVLGEARIRRINIEDVERIEVLRGPGSVLYGTNAYTGAINVVLRCKPARDKVGGRVYTGVGTYSGLRGGGNAAGRSGDLAFFVSAGGYEEDGNNRGVVDAEGVFGHYHDFRNSSSEMVSIDFRQHSLLFNAYRTDLAVMGKDPTFASGWGNPENAHGYLANYTFSDTVMTNLELRAGATFDWGQRVFAREAANNLRTSVVGYRAVAFAKSILTLPADITLELGADFDRRHSSEYRTFKALEDEEVPKGEGNLRARNVYETSGYAQVGWQFGDLGLLGGTRFTYNQLFGSNLSSRASAVYAIGRTMSVKLIVGQSYRSPSLFETYFINPERTVSGNPDLDPETSTSFEAAYLASFGGLFGQALIYYATYDKAIFRSKVAADVPLADGDPSGNPKGAKKYTNAQQFFARGAEVELVYREGPIASFASYGYVDSERPANPAPGEPYNFESVPKHKLVAGVSAAWAGAFASVAGVYLSKMEAPKPPPDDPTGSTTIDAQYKLDVNVGYAHSFMGNRIRHVLSAKNVTNVQTEVPDYVDRDIKSIPYDQTRRVMYTMTVEF